jgi:hypothetical protein
MTKNKFLILLILLFPQNCGQDYNSNSGDELLGGGGAALGSCESASDARRCAAITVIQKRCLSCHAEWNAYSTDAQWVASGKVVSGNATGSVVVSRTINAGSDMPLGGSALPQTEYQSLLDWINQMGTTTE